MNSSFSQFPLLLLRERSFFWVKSFNLIKCKAFLLQDTQGDLEQHTKLSAQGPALCTYLKQRHLCVKRTKNSNSVASIHSYPSLYFLGIRWKSKSQSIADPFIRKDSNCQISKYIQVIPKNTHISRTLPSMQWESHRTWHSNVRRRQTDFCGCASRIGSH